MSAQKLVLEITELGNAAFEEYNGCEIARILRELADRVDDEVLHGGYRMNVYDINGNRVGDCKVFD